MTLRLTGILGRSSTLQSHNSSSVLSTQMGSTYSARQVQQTPSTSTPGTSADSMGPLTPNMTFIRRREHNSDWALGGSSLELSRANRIDEAVSPSSSINAYNRHSHWCTICPEPKAILTCDGFKRHMKEHETMYVCMPYGSVEITHSGPKCAFCDTMYPDEDHLEKHMANPCAARSVKGRSYTRKVNFKKHLEVHGVDDCSDLAQRWQQTFPKRYFSCGFCGSLFPTLSEQTRHIDDHYKQNQSVYDWDLNKVVQGLLHQPHVYQAWQSKLALENELWINLPLSSFTWDAMTAKELQLRLQFGRETPEALSGAALYASHVYANHGSGFSNRNNVGSPVVRLDQDIDLGENLLDSVSTNAMPTSAMTDVQLPDIDQDSMMLWAAIEDDKSIALSPQLSISQLPLEADSYAHGYPDMKSAFSSSRNKNNSSSNNINVSLPEQSLSHQLEPSATQFERGFAENPLQSDSNMFMEPHTFSLYSTHTNNSTTIPAAGPRPVHVSTSSYHSATSAEIVPPQTRDPALSHQASHCSSIRKPASLLTRVKNQVSRHRQKDHSPGAEDCMDLDLDYLQYWMRDHDQTRSRPSHYMNTHHPS